MLWFSKGRKQYKELNKIVRETKLLKMKVATISQISTQTSNLYSLF